MVTHSLTDVLLSENLSVSSAEFLKEQLDLVLGKPVSFDARHVSHIDSPCAQLLISFFKHQRDQGIATKISGMSELIEADLSILGLTSHFIEIQG